MDNIGETSSISQNSFVKHVFNYSDNTTIHIPVNFRRIITNIAEQLKYQKNSMVNITPLETYNVLKDNFATLQTLGFGAPSKLFENFDCNDTHNSSFCY